ncbi:alpha-(1,3)-fucosyltransferase C-like [Palaemon carinicauda]|uniref:alpha-(1,3)-fucosyltransferase C-like n=1 Tax=Palaemon carinicauda TaxID=392227 RepID=UPI0035B68228
MMRHVKTLLILMLMLILCLYIFIAESRRFLNPARILYINNSTNETVVSFDWIPEVLLNGIKNRFSNSNETTTLAPPKGSGSYEVPLRGIGDSFMPFPETDTKEVEVTKKGNVTLKKIVFWNDYFNDKTFAFGLGQEPFIKAKCRINTCFTTADRTKFPVEEIDALIWHSRGADLSLPSKRSPHTRYIFWLLESPMHVGVDLNRYNNSFNWTFNYRLDSDFYFPFDRVFRSPEVLPVPIKNRALGKTKFAAWFVSNCHTKSGRATLVKTLQKWIKIDIYGGCGTLKCSRKSGYGQCSELAQRDYKFYFAFENSLCKDYATEKIFNMLGYDIIPVVYGLFNYSALIPPGSYIDARSFPNVKSLADYLIYLDKNDTAYNEYFRWKPYHQISSPSVFTKPWCDMCARLHEDQSPKVYDLYKWYITDSNCKTDSMPEVSRFVQGLS